MVRGTGEKSFKIQAYNSNLYAQYSSNFILRNSSGTNRLTLTAAGTLTLAGTASMTRLTLTQATGTAPMAVSSTTLVTNLNADRVDNLHASQFLRSDANDTTTGQIIFTKSNNAGSGGGQIYLNGSTGNRIDWNSNGVAAPTNTNRSAGTKMVLIHHSVLVLLIMHSVSSLPICGSRCPPPRQVSNGTMAPNRPCS